MFLLKPLVIHDYVWDDPTASYRWAGLSLRNNWFKFKTSGKSLIISEESINHTLN